MKPGADVMEDPLESIFGFMAPVEEIHHPGASGKHARVPNRSQKDLIVGVNCAIEKLLWILNIAKQCRFKVNE